MSDAQPDRPALPSYEAARDELADVVRRLETGGVPLEDALALWERGEELARACQQWLDGARGRLDAAIRREAEAAAPEPPGAASDGD